MNFGLFLQSSHPPERAIFDAIERDLEQIRWADALGYSEVWLGEHLSAAWEPTAAQDLVIAQAIKCTKNIQLCAGAYVLPFYHPAALAMRISQLDHMAQGRFKCGIAAGSIPSDFSLIGVDPMSGQHREMMQESLDIMLRLWTEPFEPWSFTGKYWQVEIPEPAPPIGPHIVPYQRPHPPIGMAGLSPNSDTLFMAGERGFLPLSLTFNARYLSGHWDRVEEGAASAGRTCSRNDWRVVRDIFVTETDAEAKKWIREGNMGRHWREMNLPILEKMGSKQYLKHYESVLDDEVDVDYLIDHLFLAGSPDTVARRLEEVNQVLGGFGTVLINAYDWGDDPAPYRRSLELFAQEVMPHFQAK